MSFLTTCKSPIGALYIREEGGFITDLSFTNKSCAQDVFQTTPLLVEAVKQLEEYFSGKRQAFTLPLNPKGTPFQRRVWEALQQIPYGQTASYQDIAIQIGKKNACRAVGMANHHNPIAIIIPCHRIIGKNGALTGYNGGLSIKKHLLNLEKDQ